MKKLISILYFLLLATLVGAVPAKRGVWKTLTLADGTEVRAQLVGDEHGHYWLGVDGQSYNQIDGNALYQRVDAQGIQVKAKQRRQQANASRAKRLVKNSAAKSSTFHGTKKGIIILVNFSQTSFKTSATYFQRVVNEKKFSDGNFVGSMCDYFLAQSDGNFELDFDVIGPVTVSQPYSYYGKNDSNGDDKYPATMVIEALTLADDQVNFANYDWDDDGYVDQVYVVYAGKGEADGGASSTIWPHAWTLSEAKTYGDGTGVQTFDGVKIDTYACGPELDGQTGELGGIGTMCHEFSHCLGYPDFYDIDYSGGQGMFEWDLMDSGSYNGDGYRPAGYTSYERWVAGWREPVELTTDTEVTEMLPLVDKDSQFYIIYNQGNRNEYFLLENRQQQGWDADIPGAGLLIIHVDYDASTWMNNQPNDDPSHQRMTWVAADNKYQYTTYQGDRYYTTEGAANDPFPYGSVNAFSRYTTPAAMFYNKNSDGSSYMTGSIENITCDAKGRVSFNYLLESVPPTPTPTGDDLFYESFDNCESTGGNDGMWSGSIAVGTFNPDNEGWEAEKAYGADQCARFGTSKVGGSATTPAFQLNGDAVLTFSAGGWETNGSTAMTLSASGCSITPSTITIPAGEFEDFEATLSGTGTVTVSFECSKRFFLDEVRVTAKKPDAVGDIVAQPSASSVVYNLAGQRVLRPTRGIYIINGRRVMVR